MVLSLQTTNRVDDIVATTQLTGRAPSLVAAVVRDGSIAHVVGAGENPVPDRDVQYRIGSISKTLTAATLLGLRDDGRLTLEDPIGQHLDALPDAIAGRRLRELLGMCAGLQREPDGEWWEATDGVPLADLIAGLHDGKIAFPPFARFHYSNLAYGLLGGVISTLTGKPWYEAVSERVLSPLGMARTTYHPVEPFARGFVTHPWHATLREQPRADAAAMAGAGQLWSTAADLARWAAILAGTAPPAAATTTASPLPSAATIAEMARPVVMDDLDGWTSGYGLGLHLSRRGERVFVGHTGSMPGYLAVLTVHRPSRTAVVAFANCYSLAGEATIGGLGASLLEAVLDLEPPAPRAFWRPAPGEPPADVAALCGRWWWMGREHHISWIPAGDRLVVVPPREEMPAWEFVKESPDVWRGQTGDQAGELLRVRRDADGRPVVLDIATFLFYREP
jgi:CubicO group peptidase (beta-lactamase class C family)